MPEWVSDSHSVVSDFLWPPWTIACQAPLSMNSPGKNPGVACHFLLYGKGLLVPKKCSRNANFPLWKNNFLLWASQVSLVIKNPPVKQEMPFWSLGWEDFLEQEGTATHSSILGWEIPRTEEPGGLQSMGLQRVGHIWVNEHSTQDSSISKLGEGKKRI